MYKTANYHHARGQELMNDLLEKEAGKIPNNLLNRAERETGLILGSKAGGMVGHQPMLDKIIPAWKNKVRNPNPKVNPLAFVGSKPMKP